MTPEELRQRRAALGLTQTGLARAFGMDRITIWRYETGRVPIPGWMPWALDGLCSRRSSGILRATIL